MIRLSDTDRAILSLAQLDADAPVAAIAKTLKLKEHTVRHTLSKLQDAGVIRRLLYVNLYRVGFVEYYLFLKLNNNTPAEEQKLLDVLSASERVTWLVRLGGKYSLGIAFLARSIAESVSFVEELGDKCGVQLSERALLILAGRAYFGVKHLSPQSISVRPVDMGTLGSELVEWEEMDHLVLRSLSSSAQGSAASVARELGKPESTITYRIKSLKDRGILNRTVYLVNPDSYGMSAYRLRATVHTPGKKVREKMYAWAATHPNVLSFLHCLGPWDFEFRVEVADPKDAIRVAHDLTESVGSVVSSTEIVPTLESKCLSHYPLKSWPIR
jgi:DNA-binding Lrp family transcriptional regulator